MSVPHSRRSLIALAVAQACAFAPVAMAESAENVLPEVVVTSESAPDGVARNASVGGFTETPLLQTPASISVITSEQMQERSIRTATDAVKYDCLLYTSDAADE